MGWWQRLRERLTVAQPEETPDLLVDSEGLTVARMVDEDVVYDHVRWEDVLMIVAYKKDCYTVDQVCVEVMARGSEELIFLTEDDAGFAEVVADLGKYLRLETSEWYLEVLASPLGQEPRVVYKKSTE